MDGRTDGQRLRSLAAGSRQPGRRQSKEEEGEEEDAPVKIRRLLQQLLRDSYEESHLHYHPFH